MIGCDAATALCFCSCCYPVCVEEGEVRVNGANCMDLKSVGKALLSAQRTFGRKSAVIR